MTGLTTGLKAASAALLAATAALHYDLWVSFGYRHLPNIGNLFLVATGSGVLLALVTLVAPRRYVRWAGLAGVLFELGLLGGLLVSLNGGFLGFNETTSAPLLVQSVLVETAAVLIGLALVITGRPAGARVTTAPT